MGPPMRVMLACLRACFEDLSDYLNSSGLESDTPWEVRGGGLRSLETPFFFGKVSRGRAYSFFDLRA